ncbi:glutamate--cysteine ligase [Streptomyces sp. ISL-94]|uniref:carboxylate-amine ligase n=1 Tax=Streptomyces sp. ISL-94 TaxID=2819190 RepID=UPI001BE6ABFB|nr:glutamate--cysteine ligase [Streptomyces sp. ISL-94]MBT2478905.1 glutamate--cysteine ligase [Streptomyces sp. ISL-94]
MITVGVEEEYLLVDPDTGLPVPRMAAVRAAAGLDTVSEEDEVQTELLQAQVEIATPVCTGLGEIGGHLLRLRHAIGSAAERTGCRAALSGAAPVKEAAPVPVTPKTRYLRMRGQAPRLVDEQLINGMHVHAGVPDREMGVEVLNRIRVWLPTLLAMSANSPLWEGRDTGFASWRTVIFGRWPVTGPTPVFAGVADYDRRAAALVESGVIADTGQLYWQARLSEKYPTVEIRCADVQLRADDAVMFTGVARALVATAVQEAKSGAPLPQCPQELLHAATWQAARYGLDGPLVGCEGGRQSARDAVARLMGHIRRALEEAGDTREVTALVHRLLRDGTPADRQRRAMAEGGLPALIELITTRSTAP